MGSGGETSLHMDIKQDLGEASLKRLENKTMIESVQFEKASAFALF